MTDVDPGLEVRPAVSDLGDPCATDRSLTGSKAAALARASAVRLPVLPGFVITTAAGDVASADVRAAWEAVTDAGRQAVVVRSSSTAEDLEGSSMAGRYESVVDVHGWDAFLEATRAVLDSARTAAEGDDVLTGEEPIAVLVQPMLHARAGGVLFGVEPVTGRSDRLVVSASTHGADAVVSGRVDGSRYVLARDGSIVEVDPADDGATLDRRECEGLAQLAHAVADAFGGHQDVEWALREDGRLVLLQSRPVTTKVVGAPIGPVYGRGPVTETFPEPLAPLEEDLWVPPLREALREALRLSGAAREDALDLAPLVVTVRGRVAIDLEISGELRAAPSVLQRLDPDRACAA